MSLNDDIKDIKDKVDALSLEQVDKDLNGKVKKKKTFSIPFGKKISYKGKTKKDQLLVLELFASKRADFKYVNYYDGLLEWGEDVYKQFEEKAVYKYKKYNFVILHQTRISPVGGTVDDYKWMLYGTNFDEELAKKLGIGDFAQRTILRAVQKIEVDKEVGKKKSKLPIVWIVIGLGLALYFLAPMLGLA